MPVDLHFPTTRPDRVEGGTPLSAPPDTPGQVANTRLWPFVVRNNAGTGRSTAVSPRYTGPGIISDLFLIYGSAGATPEPTLTVLVSSDDSGQGVNQNNTILPSGTPIFDPSSRADESGSTQVDSPAVRLTAAAGVHPFRQQKLDYLVRLPEFFVKVTLNTSVAGDNSAWGYVRIVENVPPEVLRNFR